MGDIDAIEQLTDLGKPLRLVAHPDHIEHGHVVAGERHVADRGKTRRLPAIISLRQPLQPELEIRQPAFGFGARQMPAPPPLRDDTWLLRLRYAAGSFQRGVRCPLQNGLLLSRSLKACASHAQSYAIYICDSYIKKSLQKA